MEHIINLHVELLPEGVFLATSDDVPGLVAQGQTLTETLAIAREVAEQLIAAQKERAGTLRLTAVGETFDYPLVVG